MTQHQITIYHIELHIKKVKTAKGDTAKTNCINKTVGILSLAKALDIITIEEYEHYFEQLTN